MKGYIEPLTGLLRLGGDYGEEFHIAMTLRYINPEKVEICGLDKPMKLSDWKNAREILKHHGVKQIIIKRHGKYKEIEL